MSSSAKDLKNILYIRYMYIRYMKSKFKVGDKVVISPKYCNKYNGITTVGTVTKVSFNGDRRVYVVKFKDKRYEKYFYSYELELAPEEKIETQKKEDALKNKPIIETFFRSQDEVEKPLFNVGDKVFLTSQAIEWLKEYDLDHIIDPKDYHKQFEVTRITVRPYKDETRICYILNHQCGVYFVGEDLTSTHQTQNQTSIDSDTLNRLKKSWITISNIYLHEFCRRHEFEYSDARWISDNPGTTVEVCDMLISMEDIRYDVDNQIDPDMFQKWYYKSLDVYELTNGAQSYLNYPSFCESAPDPFTEDYMKKLQDAHKRVQEAKEALKLEIETFKENKKLF